MSKKNILAFVFAFVLLCTVTITAFTIFADTSNEDFGDEAANVENKFDAARKKWNSLSDDQKAEIYDIKGKIADLRKQLADKYKEFGIIGEETAEKVKNRISERHEHMKENGRMPYFGKRRKMCSR